MCRFQGIVIKMRFDDADRHYKPHIHVEYNEYEASISLTGELLAGSLPAKELTRVLAWVTLREEELYNAWNKAIKNQPVDKIAP